MDVFAILKEKSAVIDAALPRFLPDPASAARPEVKELYEMEWDYFKRGGKRLRPALCLLTAEWFGAPEAKALPTAVALEMLQNFVLIHDDIQDHSESRRGKPCLHHLYGVEKALNAGDGLYTEMWKALSSNHKLLGSAKALKIMAEFEKLLDHTIQGQAIELYWVQNNAWNLSERDYLDMVKVKTARYTIVSPTLLGTLVAGAPRAFQSACEKFGLPLGIAFQIQDDVLNLAGEEGKYGKEIAGDLYEGKRTLMLIHVLQHASADEKKFILSAMGKPREQKTPDDMNRVLDLMRKHGSLDYARAIAKKHAAQAKKEFDKRFTNAPTTPAREKIQTILDFITTREF